MNEVGVAVVRGTKGILNSIYVIKQTCVSRLVGKVT